MSIRLTDMSKWKKDETEFKVRLLNDDHRGSMLVLPISIALLLEMPKYVTFNIKNKKITISTNKNVVHN